MHRPWDEGYFTVPGHSKKTVGDGHKRLTRRRLDRCVEDTLILNDSTLFSHSFSLQDIWQHLLLSSTKDELRGDNGAAVGKTNLSLRSVCRQEAVCRRPSFELIQHVFRWENVISILWYSKLASHNKTNKGTHLQTKCRRCSTVQLTNWTKGLWLSMVVLGLTKPFRGQNKQHQQCVGPSSVCVSKHKDPRHKSQSDLQDQYQNTKGVQEAKDRWAESWRQLASMQIFFFKRPPKWRTKYKREKHTYTFPTHKGWCRTCDSPVLRGWYSSNLLSEWRSTRFLHVLPMKPIGSPRSHWTQICNGRQFKTRSCMSSVLLMFVCFFFLFGIMWFIIRNQELSYEGGHHADSAGKKKYSLHAFASRKERKFYSWTTCAFWR